MIIMLEAMSDMSGYNNFQTDNKKYTSKYGRTDIKNPEFNPTVSARSKTSVSVFEKNLDKYVDLVSYYR